MSGSFSFFKNLTEKLNFLLYISVIYFIVFCYIVNITYSFISPTKALVIPLFVFIQRLSKKTTDIVN